jgi:hypothetical protein
VPTEIKLIENEVVTVAEDYRSVYDKLLAVAWQEPCEFMETADGSRRVTVNPTYVVYVRAV